MEVEYCGVVTQLQGMTLTLIYSNFTESESVAWLKWNTTELCSLTLVIKHMKEQN